MSEESFLISRGDGNCGLSQRNIAAEASCAATLSTGDELIRQAAQGGVVHNDDTSMRVLSLDRGAASDVDIAAERTGVFTSGIISIGEGYRIGLYFTGRKHAGENLASVLKQRVPGLEAPIQMCDALSRNCPRSWKSLSDIVCRLPAATLWK